MLCIKLQIKKIKDSNGNAVYFIISVLFALSAAGGLAVVRVPGAEGGTVPVLVPAGVALGRGHAGA